MKETLKQSGMKYVGFNQEFKYHILQDSSGKNEAWFANKSHASYGIIWKNTHLEFLHSLWKNNLTRRNKSAIFSHDRKTKTRLLAKKSRPGQRYFSRDK